VTRERDLVYVAETAAGVALNELLAFRSKLESILGSWIITYAFA
jgi:hypothetical protein